MHLRMDSTDANETLKWQNQSDLANGTATDAMDGWNEPEVTTTSRWQDMNVGKPSWAELGKWIGWCVVDWWRKLWIVSRSRRSVGGTSKSQVVCFGMFVHWGFFLVLKFLTRSAFAEKKYVGTWLWNLITYRFLCSSPCILPSFGCVCVYFAS